MHVERDGLMKEPAILTGWRETNNGCDMGSTPRNHAQQYRVGGGLLYCGIFVALLEYFLLEGKEKGEYVVGIAFCTGSICLNWHQSSFEAWLRRIGGCCQQSKTTN